MSKAQTTSRWQQRVLMVLNSSWLFWLTVGFFVMEAVWLALSGLYPMAFDEDFHLGIIRLYAHHISPFWSGQPEAADMFGAVARDPSYLYQYLLSFPYRLISLFTADQTVQILWLRAINIGLFTSGLVLFRRLLLRTGASRAVVAGVFMVFVLIPVMPLLAAQINYDNLLFPLTAIVLLLTLRINDGLRQQSLDVGSLLGLVTLGTLASLVKYAFLPIFLTVVIYLLVRFRQVYKTPRTLLVKLESGYKKLSFRVRWLLLLVLILSLGLFVQRYGINMVRYHTPVPDCGKVLSYEACKEYGPWIRNYNFKIANVDPQHNPLAFMADWFYGIWLRLFFAVDGPATDFQTRGPLLVPALVGMVLPVLAAASLVLNGRRLLRRYDSGVIWLLVAISGAYVGALWLNNYLDFVRTGQPVAINGRYLLPILLPLLLLGALAINEWLNDRRSLKLITAALVIVCMLWGGGALTYILRSNDSWYWPNQTVRDVNHAVQRTIGPLVPGYDSPTAFLR